jgi:alpha-1,3-rhamnosyl/mannosyltransferase
MLARYSREVDVSHTIGHVAAPVSGVDTIPLLTDLGAVLSPGSSDAAKSSNLERLCRQITKYPAISTVSEFARAELIAAAGCDPARVVVIPPGVDEAFRLGERAEDDFELQAIGLLPQQFFLHTSAPSEGDNLAMLLLAYSNLPAPIRAWLPLVVVGGRLRQRVALPVSVEADIEAGNIRLMSAQPAFLLRILYQKARLTLFPAMHEGFGLALAEALVCGASVVVSEGSANANIAGPRAIKLNPSDVWAWRGALVDQVDRGAHGIHRVSVSESDMSQFSWDRSAETALSLYRRVLEREHEFA